jgi:cell wall-associated NlpC family hydrolase
MSRSRAATGALFLLLSLSCAVRSSHVTRDREPPALPRIEYSVQVGAFADPANAQRLIATLAERGLEAFYFVGDGDLHRVRFGSFPTRELAVERAEAFKDEGIIGDYFVVSPEPPAFLRAGGAALRGEVVRSAMSFLGRPYRWGGTSPETGLDCSGLTMTAYRLNGLALPRAAAGQYASGEPVPERRLQDADLVFFATESRSKPTHVGLYLGEGRFIHAPGRGDVVRIDNLADAYYQRRYLGARSYLGGS